MKKEDKIMITAAYDSVSILAGDKNKAWLQGGSKKLNALDWLANIPQPAYHVPFPIVEIRFKNGRKEFFKNVNQLHLSSGDLVAVEAASGHDVGEVSLMGEVVKRQLKLKHNEKITEFKKIYRKAKPIDIEKWQQARELDNITLVAARKIARSLSLNMKISDVEYQGDMTKVVFYYTAEDRVDFRTLIVKFAEAFKVRIEMKQIGMRQEAARLGSLDSSGKEVDCAAWLSSFKSVSTNAARIQQLSVNSTKLAGQCSKLKCCLNYELGTYEDAIKQFPSPDIVLETQKGKATLQKTNVFKASFHYSYTHEPHVLVELALDRVNFIIAENKKGNQPSDLKEEVDKSNERHFAADVLQDDNLSRFDNKNKKRHSSKNRFKNNRNFNRDQKNKPK